MTTFDKKSKKIILGLLFISLLAIIAGIITSLISKKDSINDDTKKKLEKSSTFLEGIGIPLFFISGFVFAVLKSGEIKK